MMAKMILQMSLEQPLDASPHEHMRHSSVRGLSPLAHQVDLRTERRCEEGDIRRGESHVLRF